jgi:hypothetical protein
MYILVVSFRNGSVSYTGPFPTKGRAEQYARSCEAEFGANIKWHTVPLVVPYAVVSSVKWRE